MSYEDDVFWATKAGRVYGRRFKPWTDFEEQELRDMFLEGGDISDIAEVMERSEKAIRYRLTTLIEKGMLP